MASSDVDQNDTFAALALMSFSLPDDERAAHLGAMNLLSLSLSSSSPSRTSSSSSSSSSATAVASSPTPPATTSPSGSGSGSGATASPSASGVRRSGRVRRSVNKDLPETQATPSRASNKRKATSSPAEKEPPATKKAKGTRQVHSERVLSRIVTIPVPLGLREKAAELLGSYGEGNAS